MPIVNIDLVPEYMQGDRAQQYRKIGESVTDAIVSATGAPAESIHVLIREVAHDHYSVGGTMLAEKARAR